MAGEAEDLAELVLVLPALQSLFATVKNEGLSIYAALYELNDPELIGLLAGLGQSCHLLLEMVPTRPALPI